MTTDPDTGLAQALATLANRPDPDAWSLVLEQVGESMENLAQKLTGDDELARDAVQEALLQIRDSAESFRAPERLPDRAARSWILCVTAHTALTLRRKQQRRRHYEGTAHRTHEASNTSAEHRLVTNETAELIRTHLAELPEATRAAIVLRHCEGMGFTDVATALGIPEGTAKIRVHRGLATLRERLTRVGFAISVPLIANALGKLPVAEATVATFSTTSLAQSLLYEKSGSTLPFISIGITKTTAITVASMVAVVLVGSFSWLLSHDSPVTVVPTAPVPSREADAKPQAEIPQPPAGAFAKGSPIRVLVGFNGDAIVDGVTANINNKYFKSIVEKELTRMSGQLPGTPKLRVKYWYDTINGAAFEVLDGPADSAEKFKQLLEAQSYIKIAQWDQVMSIHEAGPQ